MMSVEEMIKESKCFGIAFDKTVKECKICEVRTKCECKCRLGETSQKPDVVNIATKDEVSDSIQAMKKSLAREGDKTAEKPVRRSKQYSPDMPVFKYLSLEELKEMYKSFGGDPTEFDKYDNDKIYRMRLVMGIKKHYEIKQ